MIHPPGLIGVIAQETSRYTMFAASMTSLDIPDRSEVKWIFGHDIAANTNMLVREMLDRPWAEWLWIMGDDHAFSPPILKKLLDREKDIVVPLCLQRNAPYRPVALEAIEDDGKLKRLDLDLFPFGGVVEVVACGSAGMLIRRKVLVAMDPPWFESGVLVDGQLMEDLYFCVKARQEGFEVWCDLDTMLGHCSTTVVWPVLEEDGWTFGFSMMGGFQLTMPRYIRQYADDCV